MSKLTITGIKNEITNRIKVIDADIEVVERLKRVSAKDNAALLDQINSLMCKNAAKTELKSLLAKIRMNRADDK